MSGDSLRALVIEHQRSAPSGYLGEWLEHRGSHLDVLRIDADERGCDLHRYDLIVSLGSECAAYDDSTPWLELEMALLGEAIAGGVPVLGICFGSQLLARVLGGKAFRAERPEIGWYPIDSRNPELVAGGPWFQWHVDTFTTPPGAQLIAENAAGPQAFSLASAVGLQFHPEASPEIIAGWARTGGDELDHHGIDPQRLMRETNARANGMRAAAWKLFDSLLVPLTRGRFEHAV